MSLAALDASKLGAHQGGAVLEILRAVLSPDFKLSVVSDQSLDMQPSLAGRCGLAECRSGECTVKLILCRFEVRRTCPNNPLRPLRGLEGGRIVAGKEARLQLADPVHAFRPCQIWVTGEATLHPKLGKLLIVKATEIRRQAAERPNERELRGDGVIGKIEPDLLRKRETTLGFALHFIERIARGEKVRVQVVAAVPGKG